MVIEVNNDLKDFLDEQVDFYNQASFISDDPVSVPHRFSKKEDIEISGFFAAVLAWGNRKSIISNTTKLLLMMDNAPHEFILSASNADLKSFKRFVHRTFNGIDCLNFIKSLQNIYKLHKGIENVFNQGLLLQPNNDELSLEEPYKHPLAHAITHFRNIFIESFATSRSNKHIAAPLANSSAKRICMYLRWMVRNDYKGVDFGLWRSISPSMLCCPIDVHSARVARELGLLQRNQNDWKSVIELTTMLRKFDNSDPVKYDFALFGMGVNRKI